MPVLTTYPGVYIEELPSGVRTITPVATSITAFIGRARRGPVNEPVLIHSFGDFERVFGDLWSLSPMTYAVQQFYMNGGSEAMIVRVFNPSAGSAATFTIVSGATTLTIEAASPGAWGNDLLLGIDLLTQDTTDATLFNILVFQKGLDPDDANKYSIVEKIRNVSLESTAKRYVMNVIPKASTLPSESQLIRATNIVPAAPMPPVNAPNSTPYTEPVIVGSIGSLMAPTPGSDGNALVDADIQGNQGAKTGMYALEKADLFNLLCIPPIAPGTDPDPTATLSPALAYCKTRRAMLIVDPPQTWLTKADAVTGVTGLGLRDQNAAIYFPRVRAPDALQENRLVDFVPCGVVCGVIARTDVERGVWKAPAGLDATLAGVRELTYKLTDAEQGDLNPLAVNCLRTFPVAGHVVWGARTLKGADALASEWKYLPVRRTTLFIEESLYRGTQWVVFEPNDEPLWAQIRIAIGAFMHRLFKQGAFQGQTARDAYLVKCDAETTTQNDIDLGIVNILVAFAPLKPAEFVILKIQQKARLPET
jgi:phage tail sheath protein FI